MSYILQVVEWFRTRFADPAKVTAADLNLGLRVLAIWKSRGLVSEFEHHHGLTILQGPFQDMAYVGAATEGALLPRLIGSYEQELHPAIAAFVAEAPDCVIDVGCAEGYYAVGLVRLMPGVEVHARDTDVQIGPAPGATALADPDPEVRVAKAGTEVLAGDCVATISSAYPNHTLHICTPVGGRVLGHNPAFVAQLRDPDRSVSTAPWLFELQPDDSPLEDAPLLWSRPAVELYRRSVARQSDADVLAEEHHRQ